MDTEFIKIYHLLKNDILRIAYSYTKDLTESEDITQEVFVKLYEHFADFNDDEHIKRWCIKVTINKCKNLFLSSWKKKITFLAEGEENKIPQKENNKENNLLESLMKLPQKYRILILLHYYEEYKIKDIANILNIKESTVQTRMQRARNQLEKILKEDQI